MLKKLLTSTAISPLLPLSAMTPAERAAGRFMRAPDGHDGGDAGGDAGADAGATGGEGGGDAGASGAADGAGDDDSTVLGGEGKADAGTGDGEGKGEDGDGADGDGKDTADAGPPEKYELNAPEGFEALDTELLAEAEPTFRELNLTNEQAQQLMPLAGKLAQKAVQRAETEINNRAAENRKSWAEAFEADPEIGGANKAKTIADAARAFDHYGIKPGEGVRQLLDESGLGNHPDLIRFVARVGRDLAEGSFDRGDAAPTKKTKEQALYGPEFQPKG